MADALREAGIEVWFDRSELRGGDAWDRQIRDHIHDCRLFVPIVSASTESRAEGYFRREWKLAVDRTHDLSERFTFLVPVAIDGTSEQRADVPDAFRHVQWTRLPGGQASPAFVRRIQGLLNPGGVAPDASLAPPVAPPGAGQQSGHRARWAIGVAGAVVVAVAALLGAARFKFFGAAEVPARAAAPPAANAFTPPPHSLAVLPFENMSGDPKQEYFSDGLTEELLNSLAAIEGLQVAARTSSFSFKGTNTDIGTIARKLNVGALLEGSVRRSGHTVRITTQLVNAATGFHLWSKTFDRDAGDILRLQTEIATSVADTLKVTLLGDVATKIELGGTRIPAAFDAYLRGRKADQRNDATSEQEVIAQYTEAIRLDPNYALAWAARSAARSQYAAAFAIGTAIQENVEGAGTDARQALALAPALGDAHMALALHFQGVLDFARARDAYERAREYAPANASVLRASGRFGVVMGQVDAGLAALRRAALLDPLNTANHAYLGQGLFFSRRYREAVAATTSTISLDPETHDSYGFRGLAYYEQGDLERARESCEAKPSYWASQQCLAIVYEKLGRHAEAQATLGRMHDAYGESVAYQYAGIHAQWGDKAKALEWLDAALRLRDVGLNALRADPLMDPIRDEPRFRALLQRLKFPD